MQKTRLTDEGRQLIIPVDPAKRRSWLIRRLGERSGASGQDHGLARADARASDEVLKRNEHGQGFQV